MAGLKFAESFQFEAIFESNESVQWPKHLPVSINETGIDVVRALNSSNGLKTHSCGLVWHYVDKAVLELVAGQIGTDESWRMGFSVS